MEQNKFTTYSWQGKPYAYDLKYMDEFIYDTKGIILAKELLNLPLPNALTMCVCIDDMHACVQCSPFRMYCWQVWSHFCPTSNKQPSPSLATNSDTKSSSPCVELSRIYKIQQNFIITPPIRRAIKINSDGIMHKLCNRQKHIYH